MLDAPALARGATVSLALFLLLTGALVAARGRDRASRTFLGAYLGLVGLNYLLDAGGAVAWALGVETGNLSPWAIVAALLDPPLLVLFALVVAGYRLTPARVALVLAPAAVLLLLYAATAPADYFMASWRYRYLYLLHLAPCYALSFLLVLRRHLEETDPPTRERLGALVVVAGLVVLPRLPLLGSDMGLWRTLAAMAGGNVIASVALVATMLALYAGVVVAVRRQHSSARPGGPHARPLESLGLLLGLVAVAWLANASPLLRPASAPLLYSFRWLLVAAVLGVTLRGGGFLDLSPAGQRLARRAVAAVLLAVGILEGAAVFAVLGLDPFLSAAASAGIAAALAAAFLAFRRAFPPPADEMAWRRSNLYRALLERGVPEAELAAARARWSISPEEDAQVRALAAAEGALPPATRASPLAPGAVALGRYEVVRLLGAGGSGRAFLAWDRARREQVVLKEPHGLAGADERRAWAAEAEALARVDSPHVARLRALEEGPSGPLLVMDHVEGETLRARLGRGLLAPQELDGLARGLLGGVGALHRAGLVHRDVKPENVLLRPDGAPVLVDLGLAGTGRGDTRRVPPGGTPGYASPEQLRGESAGPASDLYSVARVLWEAGGAREPSWRDAIQRGLDPEPSRRWRDAAWFSQALPPLASRVPVEAEGGGGLRAARHDHAGGP